MKPDVERILRACVAQREREVDKVPGQTETLCREILRLRGDAVSPPWLADAAEALGEVLLLGAGLCKVGFEIRINAVCHCKKDNCIFRNAIAT